MKASVIVLNWNGKEYLKECFESLEKQIFSDFEVIMVDNASSDGSVGYVKNIFPWVKIIENSTNLGLTGGYNIGFRQARGDYVVILNNDTITDKNWLGELVKTADSDKRIGMVASKMYFMDNPKMLCSTGLLAFTDGSAIDRGVKEIDKSQYDSQLDVFGPCGGSGLYKREMLEKIKIMNEYFDKEFFTYYEDLDLAYRGRLLGYICRFAPASVVYHKVNASSRRISNLGLTCGIKNKAWMIIKDFPDKMLIKYLPFIITRQFISFVYYLVIKPNKAATKARFEMIKKIPLMLKKRKIIQNSRRITSEQLEMSLKKRPIKDYLFFRY